MRLPRRVTSTPGGCSPGTLMFSSVPARQRHVVELGDDPRGEVARRASKLNSRPKRKSISRSVDCCETAIAGMPEHDALERRGDRAGVGDVVAQVRAVVDAGDDQLGLEVLDQAELRRSARSRPACRRSRSRSSRRRSRSPATHSGRRVVIIRAIAERLPSGRDHEQLDARHRRERAAQRQQPLGVDAVVVGEQNVHARPPSYEQGRARAVTIRRSARP